MIKQKKSKLIIIYHRYGTATEFSAKLAAPVCVSKNHLSELYEVSYMQRTFKDFEDIKQAHNYAQGFRDALLERLRA